MVELLDFSDVSLSCIDSFHDDFKTSTPRRGVTELSFGERSNISVTSIRPPGPPPPVPKRPKPQTAITKSTFEDIEICVADKSLRKIRSAKALLECWYREMNGSTKTHTTRTMSLKRRHSEVFRRRFTTKTDHVSLEIVPENDLSDVLPCAQIHKNSSRSSSERSRKNFVRNCPARKARRSRVTSSKSVVETTPGSSVSQTASGQHPSGFGKISRYGNRDFQIPSFVTKKCDCNVSFIAFV